MALSQKPFVTTRPLLPRQDQQPFAFTSGGQIGTSTIWSPIYCPAGYTVTTSSTYYQCCLANCIIPTGCSGNAVLLPPTNTVCGPASTCTADTLYPSVGATNSWVAYWCSATTITAFTAYLQTPGATGGVLTTSSSTSATTSSNSLSSTKTTSSTSFGTQTGISVSPSSSPSTNSSPSHTGAIIGAVIGGIALIGLIALAAVFLVVSRKRAARNANGVASQGQQTFPPGQSIQQAAAVNPYHSYPQTPQPYVVDAQKLPVTPSPPPPQGYAELGANPAAPQGYYEMPAGK